MKGKKKAGPKVAPWGKKNKKSFFNLKS